MSSLANFSAAVCKRYSIDFSGILQYIANQLKDGKNLDLIVLREIVLWRDLETRGWEYPLKLTAHMVDQSQETFVQFYQFLRSNLKPEDYAKRMPSVSDLLTKYHVPTDAAMCLTRFYFNRINALYDEAKKSFKEDAKTKLDTSHKLSLYTKAFNDVVNDLEEELIRALPESFGLTSPPNCMRLSGCFLSTIYHVPSAPTNVKSRSARKRLLNLPTTHLPIHHPKPGAQPKTKKD
uniref:Uncharacterized protein n=1 Tax=Ditylenchus dipsaci TaxID=166011 RepID=A0A915DV85_9BILA